MPTQIYCEFPKKILQNKKEIEKKFNIKLSNKAKIFILEGKAEDEFLATQFVEAINTGFSTTKALSIAEEGAMFQQINIKDHTKSGNLERIRARIIGARGKVLATLENLTDCYIILQDNSVGIVGQAENVANAAHAVQRIIEGAKQSNVYAYLEKQIAARKTRL